MHNFQLRMRTPFPHPQLPVPGEALRVTFDGVTSSEKAPLGRILRNLRLRMRAPKGITFDHIFGQGRFRSRDFRSSMHNGQILWILRKYDFVPTHIQLICLLIVVFIHGWVCLLMVVFIHGWVCLLMVYLSMDEYVF